MASSLDPDNFPQGANRMPRGRSFGPGDSSDSGSDMAGPGLDDDVLLDPLEDLDTSDLAEDAEPPVDDDAAGDIEADAGFDDDDEPESAERAPRGRRAGAGRKGRGQPHRLAARGRRAAL
jgi:hypothetical protein